MTNLKNKILRIKKNRLKTKLITIKLSKQGSSHKIGNNTSDNGSHLLSPYLVPGTAIDTL